MYHETEDDVAGIVLEPPPSLGRVIMLLVSVTTALVALTVLISCWRSSSHDTKREQVDSLTQYHCEIAEWTVKRNEAHRLLNVLRRDRQSLIERLKCLGVRSSAELTSVPAARPLAEELAEVVRQIHEQEQKAQRRGVMHLRRPA